MDDTRGQRIIRALNQLQQFLPGHGHETGAAVNVITGVIVRPVIDPEYSEDDDSGLLTITFQGGAPIEVNGDLYLELQMIEDGRYIADGKEGNSPIARHVQSLSDHFEIKYGLD